MYKCISVCVSVCLCLSCVRPSVSLCLSDSLPLPVHQCSWPNISNNTSQTVRYNRLLTALYLRCPRLHSSYDLQPRLPWWTSLTLRPSTSSTCPWCHVPPGSLARWRLNWAEPLVVRQRTATDSCTSLLTPRHSVGGLGNDSDLQAPWPVLDC